MGIPLVMEVMESPLVLTEPLHIAQVVEVVLPGMPVAALAVLVVVVMEIRQVVVARQTELLTLEEGVEVKETQTLPVRQAAQV